MVIYFETRDLLGVKEEQERKCAVFKDLFHLNIYTGTHYLNVDKFKTFIKF